METVRGGSFAIGTFNGKECNCKNARIPNKQIVRKKYIILCINLYYRFYERSNYKITNILCI